MSGPFTGKVALVTGAGKNIGSHRERHIVAGIDSDFSGVEVGVFAKIAACDCTFDWQTGGAIVSEKLALCQGPVIRLQVHVEPASRSHGDQRQQCGQSFSEVRRDTHV